MSKIPAILSISFRPFFILAALIAVINPIFWILNYLGYLSFSLNHVSPLFWHGHEMLFGFTGALIAGFILTASANWTNSTPYQGKSLLFLIFLWVLERVSYFIDSSNEIQFILMNLFFPTLFLMLLRKLWNFPKQRNVFIPIMLGIVFANIFHSWGYLNSIDCLKNSGQIMAIGLIRFIILLIAGRVIPFFTRKKIERVEINTPVWLNLLSLFPVALLAIPWPDSTPNLILIIILILAVTANITRQILWKPQVTRKVPILYILHMGVGLINAELIMELISIFDNRVHFTQAALHLLMTGGLGVVAIGIMTRVSLGHTGRVIQANFWTQLAYLLIILGSIIRVFIPILASHLYTYSLFIAITFWGGGFLIFIINYFKILCTPRFDEKVY